MGGSTDPSARVTAPPSGDGFGRTGTSGQCEAGKEDDADDGVPGALHGTRDSSLIGTARTRALGDCTEPYRSGPAATWYEQASRGRSVAEDDPQLGDRGVGDDVRPAEHDDVARVQAFELAGGGEREEAVRIRNSGPLTVAATGPPPSASGKLAALAR